jgi:hypothetical protein
MSPWGGGADPVLAVARMANLTFFTECHRAAYAATKSKRERQWSTGARNDIRFAGVARSVAS